MIVIDASAALEALLRTPAAASVEDRLFRPGLTLHAPHLLDGEVAKAISRYAANGDIGGEQGRMALGDLADFPLVRYPHDLLLPRSRELRHNPTAFDAAYVALAEALDAPWLTRDRHIATAAGLPARIALV